MQERHVGRSQAVSTFSEMNCISDVFEKVCTLYFRCTSLLVRRISLEF